METASSPWEAADLCLIEFFVQQDKIKATLVEKDKKNRKQRQTGHHYHPPPSQQAVLSPRHHISEYSGESPSILQELFSDLSRFLPLSLDLNPSKGQTQKQRFEITRSPTFPNLPTFVQTNNKEKQKPGVCIKEEPKH